MRGVYLSLGSNLGDRKKNIEDAINKLSSIKGIKVIGRSSFYNTEPVGFKEQPDFLNIVIEIDTDLDPSCLLKNCKNIEKEIGRIIREKGKEREIDIDIILFRDQIINYIDLKIPHPKYSQRRFVLEPLFEIAPEALCPFYRKNTGTLLKECNDNSYINRIK